MGGQAFGGVLVNDWGWILLVEPRDRFGGYAWTFPKGRPDAGETEEQTARREVLEETGLEAEILQPIPGSFEGTVVVTSYYLMRPIGRCGLPQRETWSVCWTSPDHARELIGSTPNEKGRKRDLDVLEAALRVIGERRSTDTSG